MHRLCPTSILPFHPVLPALCKLKWPPAHLPIHYYLLPKLWILSHALALDNCYALYMHCVCTLSVVHPKACVWSLSSRLALR
jgi:hypothetical protein